MIVGQSPLLAGQLRINQSKDGTEGQARMVTQPTTAEDSLVTLK
ncbi:MAG: hypothetical protein ACI9OJ_005866, partial [Myxococcota bacterium]